MVSGQVQPIFSHGVCPESVSASRISSSSSKPIDCSPLSALISKPAFCHLSNSHPVHRRKSDQRRVLVIIPILCILPEGYTRIGPPPWCLRANARESARCKPGVGYTYGSCLLSPPDSGDLACPLWILPLCQRWHQDDTPHKIANTEYQSRLLQLACITVILPVRECIKVVWEDVTTVVIVSVNQWQPC